MHSNRYLSCLLVLSFLSWQSLCPKAAAAVPLPADIQLRPQTPKQGQTLAVSVYIPAQQAAPEIVFNKKRYRLFAEQFNGATPAGFIRLRALIGIPADLKPGAYSLQIGTERLPLSVISGGFGVQHISLPKGKDNFVPSPGEKEAVEKAKETVTAQQNWQGAFKRPSKARTSSPFGLRRVVNGRLLNDYFHSGLDFAGAQGSPIYAAQAGHVLIAHANWKLHGGTVAIDHGQGVVSFYIHMSKILVEPGQEVEAGVEIGKVGMTGRANGPHLHFSIYVNGDATNPRDWFAGAY